MNLRWWKKKPEPETATESVLALEKARLKELYEAAVQPGGETSMAWAPCDHCGEVICYTESGCSGHSAGCIFTDWEKPGTATST